MKTLTAITGMFGAFTLCTACVMPNAVSTPIDCGVLLAEAPNRIDAPDGEWAGHARAGDGQTPFELRLVDGRAYASLPERAQYEFPVRAALAPEGVVCLQAPYHSAPITLRRQGRGWVGQWTDPEFEAEVTLTRATLPPMPEYRSLDFVSQDGAHLAGTLVIPGDATGPVPVLVWVHGSAPTTRDTWFYRGRANMIARQGVASLIWDKRGAGASIGERPWDMELLTQDARAAVEAARAAPETADGAVVLAGFSQGGWIAPRVAADTPWIAGVLVGAAPGITIAEQNLYSFERALLGEGVPPHIIEGAVSLLAATYDYYQTGAGYEVLRARFDHPANAGFVNEPFFRRFLFQNGDLPPPDVDPADWRSMFVDHVQYWRAVDAPVLAMWGADDNEVPAELSRQVISDALAGHGSDDRVLVVFEDATHSLYVDSDEGEAWEWERTAPGFQESVAEWLARRR